VKGEPAGCYFAVSSAKNSQRQDGSNLFQHLDCHCCDVVVGVAGEGRGDKAFGDRVAVLRHQRGEIGLGDGAVPRALGGDGIHKALRGFGPCSTLVGRRCTMKSMIDIGLV
jgi:hypothetical protein